MQDLLSQAKKKIIVKRNVEMGWIRRGSCSNMISGRKLKPSLLCVCGGGRGWPAAHATAYCRVTKALRRAQGLFVLRLKPGQKTVQTAYTYDVVGFWLV